MVKKRVRWIVYDEVDLNYEEIEPVLKMDIKVPNVIDKYKKAKAFRDILQNRYNPYRIFKKSVLEQTAQ